MHDPEEVQQKYFDPKEDLWLVLRGALKRFPNREISRRTGLSTNYIRALRSGDKNPSRESAASLLRIVDGWTADIKVRDRK